MHAIMQPAIMQKWERTTGKLHGDGHFMQSALNLLRYISELYTPEAALMSTLFRLYICTAELLIVLIRVFANFNLTTKEPLTFAAS